MPPEQEEAQSKVYKEGIENLKTALKLHESLASRSIAIKVQKDPWAWRASANSGDVSRTREESTGLNLIQGRQENKQKPRALCRKT